MANTENVSVPRVLLDEMLDYVRRFADQNEEPEDGGCRATIAEAEELLSADL